MVCVGGAFMPGHDVEITQAHGAQAPIPHRALGQEVTSLHEVQQFLELVEIRTNNPDHRSPTVGVVALPIIAQFSPVLRREREGVRPIIRPMASHSPAAVPRRRCVARFLRGLMPPLICCLADLGGRALTPCSAVTLQGLKAAADGHDLDEGRARE